jgi:uncharacterized protein with GYD domain
MPTYVLLMRNSDRGAVQMLWTGSRGGDDQAKAIQSFGGSIVCHYPVIGRYDVVSVVEFADDASCLAFGLAATASGQYVEALRTYSHQEIDRACEVAARVSRELLPQEKAKPAKVRTRARTARSAGRRRRR